MAPKQPDTAAKVLGHVAVGLAVGYATHKISKGSWPAVIVLVVLALIVHAILDAPVAQALSNLGI